MRHLTFNDGGWMPRSTREPMRGREPAHHPATRSLHTPVRELLRQEREPYTGPRMQGRQTPAQAAGRSPFEISSEAGEVYFVEISGAKSEYYIHRAQELGLEPHISYRQEDVDQRTLDFLDGIGSIAHLDDPQNSAALELSDMIVRSSVAPWHEGPDRKELGFATVTVLMADQSTQRMTLYIKRRPLTPEETAPEGTYPYERDFF